jgi:molybdate transport system regulatory protein
MRQRSTLSPRAAASAASAGASDVLRHGYPNLKGWLSWDGDFLLGPRYIRLLEGVERTGTIREACRGTGLSYRTCLERIRRMERTLGAPVVMTSRGGAGRGGAALTPVARQLVHVYRLWREEVETASQRAFRRATRRIAGGSPAALGPSAIRRASSSQRAPTVVK